MTDETTITSFLETLWRFYDAQGRHDLPWRRPERNGRFDPYKIFVSEMMLQQTQVARVIPKYHEFLRLFPTLEVLAQAPLGDVLKAWSGLGYNRRAKFLSQAAQQVVTVFGGQFPTVAADLVRLPGVGKNTAGALLAYAFNQPVTFVETNIRTVYIHHFFADQSAVSDTAITTLIDHTLDRERPREFYWALMDYGSYLKQTVGNVSKCSQTYAKQSAFHGSRRAIRGQVVRLLGQSRLTIPELTTRIVDDRLPEVLAVLEREGLIQKQGDEYCL